jgi:uncharacterized membrane protein (DUF4010 family)
MEGVNDLLSSVSPTVTKLVLAAALGLFLGLEREWSQKSAGIRTFSLITLSATLFAVLDRPLLLALGGLLVVVQGLLMATRGLLYDDRGLSLTTSVSMLVAYGVGILVATGQSLEAVLVAVLSSMLLVLKVELHEFALGLSEREVKSAVEFAVIAFVVFPLLPDEPMGPWNAINPSEVWILVVAVSAIGFVNYVIMRKLGRRGIALTGFFGGLVNSTAVIGEIATRARTHGGMGRLAVGAILLADAAMALRNTFIVLVFAPDLVVLVGLPLVAVAVVGVGLSFWYTDRDVEFDPQFDSPFSLKNALKFGGLFIGVLLLSTAAEQMYGAGGFVLTSFVGGMVSSGSTTTTAVVLASSGELDPSVAAAGVVAGSAASILVKIGFAVSIDRSLVRSVAAASSLLIGAGLVTFLASVSLP